MSPLLTRLRDHELDLLFRDWSIPVVLRRILQSVDADTLAIDETAVSYSVDAVVMPSETTSSTRTAMQHAVLEQDFHLRAVDLPSDLPLSTVRVLTADREWSVVQITGSSDGRVVTLRGQVA